jgi:hypothetical protein
MDALKNSGDKDVKKGAKASLVVLLVSIVLQLLAVYQTKYSLVSPVIPEAVFWQVAEPYVFNAIVSTLICSIALVFYFYSKYMATIIACAVAIIFQQVYPYLAGSLFFKT